MSGATKRPRTLSADEIISALPDLSFEDNRRVHEALTQHLQQERERTAKHAISLLSVGDRVRIDDGKGHVHEGVIEKIALKNVHVNVDGKIYMCNASVITRLPNAPATTKAATTTPTTTTTAPVVAPKPKKVGA